MALSSTKFVAINQLSHRIHQESSRSPLCISDSCSFVTSNGREHWRVLDEVGDPSDAIALECTHDVLDTWRKGAPQPGAGRAASPAFSSVDPTVSLMMLSSPIVAVTRKMLSVATSA
ncbi:hypothetical protein CFC21_061760 [Triticum aestivum]|uniref:Uncharacterized protein n=2 Tax=Triticum aestivum TaxID=4565 RepID=A0A3B6RGX1_WHEAT|nr:hypothetical protein CFC21_061760 [Triticum aestivum]